MQTDKRLQKLEKEIETIWRVIGENRAWHPSVITEVRKRSVEARREYAKEKFHMINTRDNFYKEFSRHVG